MILKLEKPFCTVAQAVRETPFTRTQIEYRIEKGVVRFMEDPLTKRRFPNLDDLKSLVPVRGELAAQAE